MANKLGIASHAPKENANLIIRRARELYARGPAPEPPSQLTKSTRVLTIHAMFASCHISGLRAMSQCQTSVAESTAAGSRLPNLGTSPREVLPDQTSTFSASKVKSQS